MLVESFSFCGHKFRATQHETNCDTIQIMNNIVSTELDYEWKS